MISATKKTEVHEIPEQRKLLASPKLPTLPSCFPPRVGRGQACQPIPPFLRYHGRSPQPGTPSLVQASNSPPLAPTLCCHCCHCCHCPPPPTSSCSSLSCR